MAIAVRADADILRDVLSELDRDPEVDATEVGVEVDDGVVTLSGWVESDLKRAAAERAALRVKGVRAVANDILVKGVTTRTDADVAKAVADALASNSVVPADRIAVAVDNGRVTLQGEVDRDYQRQAAVNTVREVVGVREVVDQITIKQSPPSANENDVRPVERIAIPRPHQDNRNHAE
ncbi:MAG: hypothetical protein QOF33_5020 [Thermomicrobiales bacterium]|jgi:osmotically-inducible protein OsmY|nr:hypothetical protein [Thermomicrobiales bacterium]